MESHDPDRQVGAVIADASGEVLSMGTNRPPKQMHLSADDSRLAIAGDHEWKYFMLEHAERNAIANARDSGRSLKGATIYVSLYPCANCARAIAAAGIRRLVAPEPVIATARDERWRADFFYAPRIFELSGVEVDFAPVSELAGPSQGEKIAI